MDIYYEKQVGFKVRKIRLENGLTQEQLSAKLQIIGCDITRGTLAKIEAGKRHIYLDEIRALKQVLSVEYKDLLE